MEEPPLPGLVPGDPKNRLSKQARRRVARARAECDRIQWEAIATAHARHLSDEKTRYLTNQADLKGARIVLKVLAAEYVDAGLNLKDFWAAMREEIESTANSLSLYDAQRRLLEAEFLTPPEQKVSARPRPLAASTAPEPDTVGAQINRLREECHLAPDELAVKIGIDVRSVRRHLKDSSLPYDRTLWAYETLFSKLLNRKVVINKMS
jgi:DNA-binding transcriptional regulator YiaG